jgi:hypothetical protein
MQLELLFFKTPGMGMVANAQKTYVFQKGVRL